MVAKRCLICCGDSYPKKTGTQDPSSSSFPTAENFNCQQAAERTDDEDAELQILFLLRKLLEIPEETCCKLRDHFGNASVWIECCDSCLDLVEKCKAALEQAKLFQKQYEELRSNIKTTMLKFPKKPFSVESKCEAIGRSHLITQEIDNFINITTVAETDEDIVPHEDANFVSNNLTTPAGSEDIQVFHGSITPVLFEKINTVKNEDKISFNENGDMDFNLESSDFRNNIQSGNTFVCEQINCEPTLLDNLSNSANRNLDQLVLPGKPNKSSRENKSSLKTTAEPRVSKRDGKGEAEKKHECHICLQLFKLPQELKTHLLRSHSSTETDKITATKRIENLRKLPIKDKGEKKHKCDTCGKSFRHLYRLKIHRRIHSGEKPFACDICGKGFTKAFSLKVHYMGHSGEKPFECDVCGKAFLRKDNLKVHQLTHDNRKPFECDICGKAFLLKTHLQVHQSTHSEKKAFKCDYCDSSFKHKTSLIQHRKKHGEESS